MIYWVISECDCCWHIFIDWHGGGGGGWWRCFQQISIHSCYSISYKRNNPINSNEHFGKLEFQRRSMRSFDLIYCDTAGVAAIRLYDAWIAYSSRDSQHCVRFGIGKSVVMLTFFVRLFIFFATSSQLQFEFGWPIKYSHNINNEKESVEWCADAGNAMEMFTVHNNNGEMIGKCSVITLNTQFHFHFDHHHCICYAWCTQSKSFRDRASHQ